MPKISFSYIFNEDFDRIFKCFSSPDINSGIFNDLLSNFKLIKGESLDQENTEFSFCWKKYYNIKMIVDNVENRSFFKSLTFKSICIDKLPFEIILVFNFLLDSIEDKTIFILELKYQDEFFEELIKTEFNENDKLALCKNIEKYLSISLNGLEKNYSCLINTSLEEAWKYVSHPKLFYEIISKDMIYVLKEGPISLDSPIELFSKSENLSEFILLTKFNVETLMISSYFAQVTYITFKNMSFPSIKLTIKINKIGKDKCFGSISVKPLETSLSYEMYCNVFKFWKKRVIEFMHFFERKNKTK